ncbi:hypothetical protein OB919_09795 [Halobacteria archaeon AArc-curdl1]|uniref:Uncharacterized protein n=1 Tax=Natronosalvus hydrolyticus TaxID=2979988 RepID=A0AAP3E6S2_9EURY|nr:hypothetical protein [Halobacteria archaeon AArc-curdl1]
MADTRAISTVLDVAFCLLFVTAAVGVVGMYLATDEVTHDTRTADHAAEILGSTTISVEYSLEDGLDASEGHVLDEPTEYDGLIRTIHGPIAGALADGAVTNLSVNDHRITHETVGYDDAIEGPLANELHAVPGRTAVTAAWMPYPDAPLEGTLSVGETPPPDADVSTVRLTVPSSFASASVPDRVNLSAAPSQRAGFEWVATNTSDAIVEGYFPPGETALAIERGGLDADRTVYRYERFADALDGVEVRHLEDHLEQSTTNTTESNALLADALAEQLVLDLEAQYDTPEAALESISIGDVTLVIRVW